MLNGRAPFKDELLEHFDVAAFSAEARRAAQPGLWLYRRPFSFGRFVASFQVRRHHNPHRSL